MTDHRVLVVTDDEQMVSGGLGRAHRIVVAEVEGDVVQNWEVHVVAWDVSHDGPYHGQHHDHILQFLREHQIGAVVTGHVGQSMRQALIGRGIMVFEQEGMPARNATRLAGTALDRRRTGAADEDA